MSMWELHIAFRCQNQWGQCVYKHNTHSYICTRRNLVLAHNIDQSKDGSTDINRPLSTANFNGPARCQLQWASQILTIWIMMAGQVNIWLDKYINLKIKTFLLNLCNVHFYLIILCTTLQKITSRIYLIKFL